MSDWIPIDGYDYEVSADGLVRNKEKKLKTIIKNGNGYYSVSLWRNGKEKRALIHRVVAKAFLGSIEGLEVNHKDFDKSNNKVSNLEIVTKEYNVNHAKIAKRYTGNRFAFGSNNGSSKLNEKEVIDIRNMRKGGASYKEIMSVFNIKKTQLSNILSGKSWKYV